ncbi:hypothetical protein CH371_06685 [Leptospira wolffii]|uniref:WG repeat-containing protein n=1 Tax=Leptospira wolffii TaxID=409998 RepID=A0A2M9ZGX5_9LEPT|nr:WG repeat-containing protein [Leptospira wolffii]PJZ67682.1 hypothetical protein CH371_06685 [Leptospira wolffii]
MRKFFAFCLLSLFVYGCFKKEHPCKTEFALKAADVNGVAGFAYEPSNPKVSKVVVVYENVEESLYTDENILFTKLKGLQGVVRETGEELLPPAYKWIGYKASNGLRSFVKSELAGYLGSDWKEKILPTFEAGGFFSEGYAVVKKDGKYGIIDTKGKFIVPTEYEMIRDFSDGMAAFSTEGEFGFLNTKGEAVILPQFKKVSDFHNGVAIGELEGTKVLVNKKGEYIGPPGVSIDYSLSYEYYRTVKNGKYGLIDSTGKEILRNEYDSIYTAQTGKYLRVKKGNLWGVFDSKGKTVVPLKYATMGVIDFETGPFVYFRDGKYFLLDSNGKEKQLSPKVLSEPSRIQGSPYLKFAAGENLWGLLDLQGNIVLNPEYSYISTNPTGYWSVHEKGYETYLFTPEGKLYPMTRNGISSWGEFSEGLASVGSNSTNYGFIDVTGKLVIPQEFSNVGSFSEGLASAQKNGTKWGYIDKTGDFIIEPKFDSVFNFHNGLAIVEENKRFGIIDKNGNYVIPPTFEKIESSRVFPAVYTVTVSGKRGVLGLRACSGL